MHCEHLQQALDLAKRGKGFCAPNPAVGAIVVKKDRVLGEGYHAKAGTPHAEIHALAVAGEHAKGATLYVTLEPCCHIGRTPPCTEAIRAAGIAHVYFAYLDPNPLVAGQGQAWLNRQGILCEHLPLTTIDDFYRSYQHWMRTQTPWVTAKLAQSLDGKIAGHQGEPIALTNAALQPITHAHRQKSDALLTSVKTIIHDDPLLNVRLDHPPLAKKIYVLDRQLRFPLSAKILKTAESITVFHEEACTPESLKQLTNAGIRCLTVPVTEQGLNLHTICALIGKEGIHDLWVEAGGQVFYSFLQERLLQEAYLYITPQLLGTQAQSAFTSPLNLMTFFKKMQVAMHDHQLMCHFTVDNL